MKISNSNVSINVREMESSISFYQSIGFHLEQRWNNHYAKLTAPGLAIGLHPTENSNKTEIQNGISLGFTTTDFETIKDELSQLGIRFIERTEEGGDFIHFHDPDGTPLYFIRPKWSLETKQPIL